MDSVPQQQSQQTAQQSTQESPSAQILIGQNVSPIVTQMDPTIVSQTNHNSVNDSSVQSCSSANTGVSASISATIMSSNVSEAQTVMNSVPNLSVTSSSMGSTAVSTGMSSQGSIQTPSTQSPQLITVSAAQPQLVPASQSAHMNATNALVAQSMAITPVSNPTVQMGAQQSQQHNPMQPLLQTSVQPSAQNQMSVAHMSSIPQMQVIGQSIGGTAGTYQFQQVYPQQMLLPGNLTIQNMPFGATNQGLSLQIPFSGTGGVSSGTMPITSIAAKPTNIMSKGMAIQSMPGSQHHMISSHRLGPQSAQQILKQVLPAQQMVPHSTTNQTMFISQLMPHQNQHSMQQSILPATANRLLDASKGKPFGTGTVRSSFGNKVLSHSTAIQPKSSPILPATSISSSLMAGTQFKAFPGTANTQLIATQTPSNLINPQILSSFQALPQGLNWTTGPQSTHLMTPNGQIFFRTATQNGEHVFIQTSNMPNMSSPQLQAVSLATPLSVHNTGTTIQVNATPTQSTTLSSSPIVSSIQPISMASNVNQTAQPVSTVVNTIAPPPVIGPTPIATPVKPRNIRQASSVATQTAAPVTAQKQHVESTSTLKPIAPAKPKLSTQSIPQTNKAVNKESNTTPTMRSTSVGSTQTVSQPLHQTNKAIAGQPTPQSNKSDAANQTTRISVATETLKANSQVSSTRPATDQNKQIGTKSNSSTNTSSELIQPKVTSVAEEVKTPPKRGVVEKKDASTEHDSDLMPNICAQHNHKSVQNAIQTTVNASNTTVSQQNGQQIPVLTDLNRQDIAKQPPQKAIVKPQILTHVIDGYIIQESPNPFPVNGLSYSCDTKVMNDEKNNNIIPIESIKSKNKNENSVNSSGSSTSRNRSLSDRHLCQNCGSKRKSNSKNNKNLKRFCSQLCSEKFNSCANSPRLALYNSVTGVLDSSELQRGGQDLAIESSATDREKQTIEEKKKSKPLKRMHENTNDFVNTTKNGDSSPGTERNQRKPTPTPTTTPDVISTPSVNSGPQIGAPVDDTANSAIAGLYIPPGGRNPLQWSVNDVFEFVRNLQGCTEYADEFRSQEIDGQALMLIKEDHLMNTMNMKLGPALKICSKINALREDVQRQS